MSETPTPKQGEKVNKTRRKPEDKTIPTHAFVAMRQASDNRQPTPSSNNGFLQRQCRCGKHTIGGGLCETCRQQEANASNEIGEAPASTTFAARSLDLSAIPAHTIVTSAGQHIQPALAVNAPGDAYEQEADHVADQVMRMSDPTPSTPLQGISSLFNPIVRRFPTISRFQNNSRGEGFQAPPHVETRINQMQGSGQSLPESEQNFFGSRMGYDFSDVRVHTDSNAIQASRDIQAHAFTVGSNIAFDEGNYQPGTDAGRRLLAHELTHVVQQTGHAHRKFIQRVINPKYDVTAGHFDVTVTLGGGNLPITIKFTPGETAPYSNQIGLIQVVKLTNAAGTNIEPQSLPASRGASLRTTADAASGVEGGFFTDALHNDAPAHGGTGTDAPAGSDLPPQYPFGNGPAQPSPTTPGLSRPNSGSARGAIVGYKRSNDAGDIKAAELTDGPGYGGAVNAANPDISFKFETVAKGEDSQTTYGALKWSFDIKAGVVANETASVADGQSATFDSALEKHRDFYVHEPVIFYFDFDSRTLSTDETNKIDSFLDYLHRFPDVKVAAVGAADRRGNAQYNLDLSLARADAVGAALRAKGVPETQIEGITIGQGATEAFTSDATTDQDSDANRRGNRRVVLSFRHVPGSAPAAPAGGGGGGGAGP